MPDYAYRLYRPTAGPAATPADLVTFVMADALAAYRARYDCLPPLLLCHARDIDALARAVSHRVAVAASVLHPGTVGLVLPDGAP